MPPAHPKPFQRFFSALLLPNQYQATADLHPSGVGPTWTALPRSSGARDYLTEMRLRDDLLLCVLTSTRSNISVSSLSQSRDWMRSGFGSVNRAAIVVLRSTTHRSVGPGRE